MKKRHYVLLLLIVVAIILGYFVCNKSETKNPWMQIEEAKTVMNDKKYVIMEETSLLLLDGTEVKANIMLAKKGDNFLLIVNPETINQYDEIKEAIEVNYDYDYYVVHNEFIYVMTKKSAKDFGVYKYLQLMK